MVMKAIQPGPWTNFPWHFMGDFKYLMYTPLVAEVTYSAFTSKGVPKTGNDFVMHILILSILRHFVGQAMISLSRWPYLTRNYEIQRKGVTFEAVDHYSTWDDVIIFDALILAGFLRGPPFGNQIYPAWDFGGLVICLLLHMGPSEAVYYWLHRALHNHYLYTRYHSHHHALFIPEANAGSVHPFAEHVAYAANFIIPIIGTWALGRVSVSMVYIYIIVFDIVNAVGHCNFEFVPECLFRALPFLKYLIYTPSYHSLHHSQVHTNFCLFMPLYDYLGGTMDKNADALHHSVRQGVKEKADFVYLTHGTDLLHMFHVMLGIQSFAATPYTPHWLLWSLYPVAVLVMALLWLFGKPFAADKYRIPGVCGETWLIPRYRFQYSLSVEKNQINALIENAIHSAEAEGCRVISLGMLNKEASLNGDGSLVVRRNPELRIRVVTGYTLTAAVVIKRLPTHVQEVFLVGSSEVSRGIALYLSLRGVRVLMLAQSQRCFERIQSEIPHDKQRFLVNVTKFQAGQQCPVWILEESIAGRDQQRAPAGTHFHHVNLAKPLIQARKDCTYASYPAMRVPSNIKGLRSCEVSLPRGVLHACHAAGLVHSLEKWNHHEVGPINVDRIDSVWDAALKHGFQLA
ncbi:hypothetical protein M758_10G117600 [Ceratodon purpureus]|nr:hypothetical protein M758_10G117600 [Ceratodon purpureus]